MSYEIEWYAVGMQLNETREYVCRQTSNGISSFVCNRIALHSTACHVCLQNKFN